MKLKRGNIEFECERYTFSPSGGLGEWRFIGTVPFEEPIEPGLISSVEHDLQQWFDRIFDNDALVKVETSIKDEKIVHKVTVQTLWSTILEDLLATRMGEE